MKIVNSSGRAVFVHNLGVLEPGENELDPERVERFESRSGKKLSDLKSPTLKVTTTTKAKKKEDDS